MNNHRTKGGVTSHATQRLFGQYGCSLPVKKARQILREIVKDEYNGHVWISKEVQAKLKVQVPNGKRLVCIVADEEIITVEDKIYI